MWLTQGVVEGDCVDAHPVARLDDHHPLWRVEGEDSSSAVGWDPYVGHSRANLGNLGLHLL